MKIFVKNLNGSVSKLELEGLNTALDLANFLKLTAPDQALACKVNESTLDLSYELQEGDHISFLDFSTKEGKELFWHSSAHILAQAVLRLWPKAQATIGPAIENGFYYDFANLQISDSDFKKIEKEMQKIVKENHSPQRFILENKEEAIEAFKDNPYKVELIKGFPDNESISAYKQGEFFDLCRGPHLAKLSKVKALKILKTSGAYWRGKVENEMLTRIYATSFPSKEELKDYLDFLEEAKKRDHKIIGPKLDLFSLKEEAPGMPLLHPKGLSIWESLVNYMRSLHKKRSYIEIKTPLLMTRQLWEVSGHWENYRENMYTTSIEERDFALKPMNCPGGMLFYKNRTHSYRELPLRVAEFGNVHRYEASGALSGLFRVRSFHQDDAHIFLEEEQIESEIINILQLTEEIYSCFGLKYKLELSTRPEEKSIGSDALWESSTLALKNALEKHGKAYKINEGDGAFYGPKIDLHIEDALKRTWQCGTIQLDMSLPERFNLEYTASDGSKKRPVMLHRALYGSVERFMGILIEHFSGRFPLWISPEQVRIITVADRHSLWAQELAKKLEKENFSVSVDDTQESISKKVRLAQLAQVNYILTIGDNELAARNCSLRTRENFVYGEVSLELFLSKIKEERTNKQMQSSFQKETLSF